MPKPASERVRPQLGDVIEIETPRGLAYAQYTHEHKDPPRHGSLLHVLPGIYPERPSAFSDLVAEEDRFSVFFPLGAALKRRLVRIVANEPIPEAKQAFPVFRSRQGNVWWLWDGRKERRAGRGDTWTARAIDQVWNDKLLIDRIASGWTPADDPELGE